MGLRGRSSWRQVSRGGQGRSVHGRPFAPANPRPRSPAAGLVIVCMITVSLLTLVSAVPGASATSTPTIATTATGSGPLGGPVADAAVLSGGSNETGAITFQVFGPDDATCTGGAVFISTVPVSGDGRYSSDDFFPSAPGTYRFIARYGGDANNVAVATACNDPGESVTVTPAFPTIVTTAAGSGPIGSQISDTALLSGGFSESGTITFTVFGPNDPSCAPPAAFTSSVPVSGDGRYSSGPFTPTISGTYQFVASYSGDADNEAVATSCGDAGESVTVGVPAPTLTNTASAPAVVGSQISDTAMLTGAGSPSGTMTFRLFGPDDATCANGAIAVSSDSVNGSGSYVSDPFTATLPGVYRFIASYSGDANNGAATTACADPAGEVTVTNPPPPVLGQSFVVTPVSGNVSVKLPGSASDGSERDLARGIGFVRLTVPRNLPLGSSVDVTRGVARVSTASGRRGKLQSGKFSSGAFKVLQRGRKRGLTELDLLDLRSFKVSCGKRVARSAGNSRLSQRVLSLLRANVHGHFRTRGRYSAGTVRGTKFDTIDRCDGTLTRVHRGVVLVRDFRRRRTIVLHAGRSYLAR